MKFPLVSLYNWYRNLIRNPSTRMWVVLGTLVYFISPIDFAPDLFPFAGQLDDVVLLTVLLTELLQVAVSGSDQKWPVGSSPEPSDYVAESNSPKNPPNAKPESGQTKVGQTIDVKSVPVDD